MRTLLLIVISSILGAAQVGHAAPPAPLPSTTVRCVDEACAPAPRFTAADWFASVLFADLGLVGGAMALALPLSALDADDPTAAGIGLLAGGALGAGIGVCTYGAARGHRGSCWAAVGGSTLGTLGFMAIGALTDWEDPGAGWLAAFTLPALGATLAYYLSVPDDSEPLGVGVVQVSGGDVGLGVPGIAVQPSRDGSGPSVSVTLLGGSF